MKIDVKDSVYENVDKIHKAQTREVYREQGIALSGSNKAKNFLTSGLTDR
jgi:hypothetical protein